MTWIINIVLTGVLSLMVNQIDEEIVCMDASCEEINLNLNKKQIVLVIDGPICSGCLKYFIKNELFDKVVFKEELLGCSRIYAMMSNYALDKSNVYISTDSFFDVEHAGGMKVLEIEKNIVKTIDYPEIVEFTEDYNLSKRKAKKAMNKMFKSKD